MGHYDPPGDFSLFLLVLSLGGRALDSEHRRFFCASLPLSMKVLRSSPTVRVFWFGIVLVLLYRDIILIPLYLYFIL